METNENGKIITRKDDLKVHCKLVQLQHIMAFN